MVSLLGSNIGNVHPLTIREVHLPIHVLSAEEAECHQFVPCLDGEARDHQRLHEVVQVCLATIRFGELGHCAIGRQTGHSLEHTVL